MEHQNSFINTPLNKIFTPFPFLWCALANESTAAAKTLHRTYDVKQLFYKEVVEGNNVTLICFITRVYLLGCIDFTEIKFTPFGGQQLC